MFFFFFSRRRRHTRWPRDWSSDVCSSDLKVGTRNAMVIADCSFGLALHPGSRRVGTGIGSAAPTPRRALDAEAFLGAELPWDSPHPLPGSLVTRFGELVAAAASPIDDVRGTAGYRRHALSVLGRRTLGWAWEEHLRCA